MTTLSHLLDAYLEAVWQHDPVRATNAGIHTYDDQLPSFDPDVLQSHHQEDRQWLARLETTSTQGLSQDEYLDWLVAVAQLRRSVADHETLKPWQRNPGVYINTVVQGIFALIERDHAPFEERVRSLLKRLRQAPVVLRQGIANLTDDTPPIFAHTALQHLAGAVSFLESTIPEIAAKSPKTQDELIAANLQALDAFEQYRQRVAQLRQEGRGQFAVGEAYYDFLLQKHHLLSLDSQTALALGWQAIAEIEADLESTAREIDPQLSWKEIVEALKRDHPPADGVLDMYTQEVVLSRSFVQDKDLVTMPEDEGFWVEWVPPFMWATLPFHASYPPRAFEESNRGFWRITPPDPAASPEQQEEKLQGHNYWNARALAMHEGYPGHHMHFCLIKQLPSRIRRQFRDPVFCEGWALYTEDLMWENGFFDDPRGRLIQLANALWRAVRVVAGISLHTKGMTPQEAADMLVDVSRLGRANATIEANRFTETPTYTVSYHLGKVLVKRLREDWKARMGRDFDLKSFHDQLLSYGAISPDVVREMMFGKWEESPKDAL